MSNGEYYVTVTARIKQRTDRAVLLDHGDTVSQGAWVPRSLLHFMSDKAVQEAPIDSEIEVRMFEWVAKREGFI